MIIPLHYIIFHDENYKSNIKKSIKMKKIKKKIFITDYDIKIEKKYMNKDYLKNQLIIEYFAK